MEKNPTQFAHYWKAWERGGCVLLCIFLFVWEDDAKPQALAWQTLSISKSKNFWRAFSGVPWQLAALLYSRAQQILAFIPAVDHWSLGRIHFTILKLINWKTSNICQNISFQYSAKLKCLHINRLSWFKKTSHNTLACLVSVYVNKVWVANVISLLSIYWARLLVRLHMFKGLRFLSENDALRGVNAAWNNW